MKISCEETCFAVSESLDRPLSLRERAKVKIHLMMCKACQRMERQMYLLHRISRHYGDRINKLSETGKKPGLSREARSRILAQLQQAMHARSGRK